MTKISDQKEQGTYKNMAHKKAQVEQLIKKHAAEIVVILERAKRAIGAPDQNKDLHKHLGHLIAEAKNLKGLVDQGLDVIGSMHAPPYKKPWWKIK